jgi:hypothetical protein
LHAIFREKTADALADVSLFLTKKYRGGPDSKKYQYKRGVKENVHGLINRRTKGLN